MLCQVCLRGYGLPVCRSCARELNPAPDRLLDGGLRVVGAFEHTGPATVLVHNLKYRGVSGYPRFVAELLAPRLPRLPLVPIPRATSRRVRYGVDPARLLAIELSRLLEVPVESVLAPVLHSRRRAGGDHSRSVAPFRVRRAPSDSVILVDDVVTTGMTILAAAYAIGPARVPIAAAANVVSGRSSLRQPGWDQEWHQF